MCDIHTYKNVFPGLTVWDVHKNRNEFLGLTVCDIHTYGNIFLGFTVWDVHTYGNDFLGFTVWDVHTYGNDFLDSSCGMYIPTEMISGIHRVGCTYLRKLLGFDASPDRTRPQPGSQEGLSPTISGSCGKDTLSQTLTWRGFQMPSRRGVKTVCLGRRCTSYGGI